MAAAGPTIKDFLPESFTLEKYVEKLAQLDVNTGLGPMTKCEVQPFNSKVLLQSFEGSMKILRELGDKNQRRVDKLEHVCMKQEKEHAARIGELDAVYTEAFSEFQVLEDRITAVSTKVVHLGDQLETSNSRRMRAMEAQNLMEHLKEFEKPKPTLAVFTDPGRRLEAGDLIFKLQMLSSELPHGEKNQYGKVKEKIARKYAEIESQLVDAFIEAQRSLDTKRMRQYAQALAPFPLGSQKVMENYIHFNIPMQQGGSTDEMLVAIEKSCKKAHDQMVEVFDSPDSVMTKFFQAIIEKLLQKRIDSELKSLMQGHGYSERYLALLHSLYTKVMNLQEKLAKQNLSLDTNFISKLTRVNLFGGYLSGYTEAEVKYLSSYSSQTLGDFQESVGISRKSGTARLTVTSSKPGEETYVSQEVCTGIIHEAKNCIKRARALLSDRELSDLSKQIYLTVLEKLCLDHFHIALDITQTVDLKSAPVGYYCRVVGNVNINMHLIDDLFRRIIMPCISYPSMATGCMIRKRELASMLEAKIESGLEKSITHMVSTVKHILATNQKKTDYRPEVAKASEGTQACSQVVGYVSKCCQVLRESLDGKNLDTVLMELGVRLHRVIFDHIQQFTVNESGAMIIICDMNEYRRVMKNFKNSFLDELFEGLQTLCNIFIVKPENLSQVCSEEPYANFDRSVLNLMMQLRADSKPKSQRLQDMFKKS